MSKKEKEKLLSLLKDQRELMQNDLQCLLDGLDETVVDNACQIIVDRIDIVLNALVVEATN
jgi:hypothetical protein